MIVRKDGCNVVVEDGEMIYNYSVSSKNQILVSSYDTGSYARSRGVWSSKIIARTPYISVVKLLLDDLISDRRDYVLNNLIKNTEENKLDGGHINCGVSIKEYGKWSDDYIKDLLTLAKKYHPSLQ